MLNKRALLLALFAAMMGFVLLDGSLVWSFQEPPQAQHESAAADHPDKQPNKQQITKTLRERMCIIWERTWDDAIAFYTFVLSIFTGLLAAVSATQIYFLIRADTTARISANAAKESAEAAALSARASIALQLPIIQIEPETLIHGDSRIDGEIAYFCIVPFLTFFNLGPTKAFPKEIHYGWTIGDVALPAEPRYVRTETFATNLIFEPDPKLKQRKYLDFEMPLAVGGWSLICGDNLNLWFYCTFVYEDFMQNTHHAGFCWRYQNVGMGMGWRTDDTPDYNKKT